jgi:hypothetical protein
VYARVRGAEPPQPLYRHVSMWASLQTHSDRLPLYGQGTKDMGMMEAFALGVVGAAAPEILRHYNLRYRSGSLKWSTYYVLATIPFLFLGGVLSIVLDAATYWSAFYDGLSGPVIVNTAMRQLAGGSPPSLGEPESQNRAEVLSATDTRWRRFISAL